MNLKSGVTRAVSVIGGREGNPRGGGGLVGGRWCDGRRAYGLMEG